VTPGDRLEAYLDHALRGDHREATHLATGLVDAGAPVPAVLDDLLIAAQREIGERWLHNRCSVADEHLVTAVTGCALESISVRAEPSSRQDGSVVVACAEGDWHGLPARFFAEHLRCRGWRVYFLGATTPPEHVRHFLERLRPDVLAVSCSVPLFFRGVTRMTEASYEAGVPALVGGLAIGGRRQRAAALGAGATGETIEEAEAAIEALLDAPVVAEAFVLNDEALALEAAAPELSRSAMDDLRLAFPAMQGYEQRQLDRTREDLEYLVRFAAAALLADDGDVWHDVVRWQLVLLEARKVPPAALRAGIEALVPRVEPVSPAAAELMGQGIPRLGPPLAAG
jgi:methanogenic corrinoid protein MtbC1